MSEATNSLLEHPLYPVLMRVIQQVANGKGKRHGGSREDFLLQQWVHLAKMHGRGFLTGQAAKKLGEAATTRHGEKFSEEMLGAISYMAMAILYEEQAGSK